MSPPRRCCTIAADPKHLGARIGVTLVLHTWGSALTHHPARARHRARRRAVADGERWVGCRPGFFLPVRVLSRLFRRRFLEELDQAHRSGRLQFFGEHAALADARTFARWLAPLRQCEWVVYAKRPFAGPAAVLAYLSRYTHRVAISNSRLVALDERGVTFRWKDYRAKGKNALQDHDAQRRGVHAPLPAARSARRLPSHPPLWAARQRRAHGQPGAGARAVERCPCAVMCKLWTPTPAMPPQRSRASCAGTAVRPMLIVETFMRSQTIRAPPPPPHAS